MVNGKWQYAHIWISLLFILHCITLQNSEFGIQKTSYPIFIEVETPTVVQNGLYKAQIYSYYMTLHVI